MNQFALTCFFILFLTGSFSQKRIPVTTGFNQLSENPREIIKANHIKKEIIYWYDPNKKKWDDSLPVAIINFDREGRTVKINKYTDERMLSVIDTFIYDEKEKLSKAFSFNVSSGNDVKIREYDYDSSDHIITRYEYNKDKTYLIIQREHFNDRNQLLQVDLNMKSNDQLYLYKKYSYNDSFNLDRVDAFDSNGVLSYSYLYEYDTVKKTKTVFLENQIGRKEDGKYFYNNIGQCVKYKSFSMKVGVLPEGTARFVLEIIDENQYNNDGTLFQQTTKNNGKKISIKKHYYYR